MMHPHESFGFRFHTEFNLMQQKFDMWMAHGRDEVSVAKVELEKVGPDHTPPTLKLSHEEAQGLFDSLWEVGFRPPERANQNDVIGAKNDHLADLQKVLRVFLEESE
jgi:hypothetical protein